MSPLIKALRPGTKKKGRALRMTPADYGDDQPHKTMEALRLAGVMADRALALVGGRGVNGRVQGASLSDLSKAAHDLRAATEEYNDYIINMT